MKKRLIFLMTALLLAAACLPALAEEDRPVIRVSGNATVSLAADYAQLSIGVHTRKESVAEAQAENALLMEAVIAAIRQAGVGEKDVSTNVFNVYSTYDASYDAAGREIRRNEYQVENMLSVTVRDLSRVGAVLDAAMAAGANATYGIRFASSQENAAYQKALVRAVEDAAGKARVLSEAAGKELGGLRLIDSSQGNYSVGISNVYNAKEAADGTAIVSGDVSVSANVVLEYEFQ